MAKKTTNPESQPAQPATCSSEAELKALETCFYTLRDLNDKAAQERVLKYVAGRLGVYVGNDY